MSSGDETDLHLTEEERAAYLELGVPAEALDADPAQLAAALAMAPRPWTECPVCGHDRTAHRPDDRLPGEPWLCGHPIHGSFGAECSCDAHPVNGGQTTVRLYDRIALLFTHDVTFDWWFCYNQDAGTRPIDLLRLGRLDELSDVVAAAEQRTWG